MTEAEQSSRAEAVREIEKDIEELVAAKVLEPETLELRRLPLPPGMKPFWGSW